MKQLLPFVSPALGLIATVIGGWLASILGNSHNQAAALSRATLLEKIAEAAAAYAAAAAPNAAWPQLLEDTIKQIATAAGLPTSNATVIQRAAVAALTKLGKAPAGAPAAQ